MEREKYFFLFLATASWAVQRFQHPPARSSLAPLCATAVILRPLRMRSSARSYSWCNLLIFVHNSVHRSYQTIFSLFWQLSALCFAVESVWFYFLFFFFFYVKDTGLSPLWACLGFFVCLFFGGVFARGWVSFHIGFQIQQRLSSVIQECELWMWV